MYKSIDGVDLKGDLYLPNTEGPKPAVLVVHGGSWSARRGEMTGISKDLANKGFVVFNITYRLAPAFRYPKPVEDVQDALDWLKKQSQIVNANQVAAWGYSAGSELVLMVGLKPENKLVAIVAGGAPTDFSLWPDSPIIKKYIGATYQERKDLWDEASPVNHVQKDSPPVFLYHGENDDLVEIEQMNRMKSALEKQNRPVVTHQVAFWGHLGTYLWSQESVDLGIQFIKSKLFQPSSQEQK